MGLLSFRTKAARDRPERAATKAPPRWPVDPDLQRRTAETHSRIERSRRQLALHVPPDRNRHGENR
jgi:hypothetical protein